MTQFRLKLHIDKMTKKKKKKRKKSARSKFI